MKNKKIFIKKRRLWSLLFAFFALAILFLPGVCKAMPAGTLLYRTTDEGKMFGYSGDPLIEETLGVMTGINPGHVGIYIGQEDGVDYIVEALASGVVKTKLEYFINESLGEKFIGAKIPRDLSPLRQAKAVALAKNLAQANLSYDIDFKKQKGPGNGEWTCVGLTEKIYESSDISNPANLSDLEYNSLSYAVDISPDGFDDYSFYNKEGDCFSSDKEFSYIAPRTDIILPLPETYGFNAGLIYKGDRYIFFPYTQFLQESLEDVVVDKKISSDFEAKEIRGGVKASALLLRWSLINNPVSALKIAFENIGDSISSGFNGLKGFVALASDKLFSSSSETEDLLVLEEANNSKSNLDKINQETSSVSNLSKIGGVTVASLTKNDQKNNDLKNNESATKASENNSSPNISLGEIKSKLSSLISSSSALSSSASPSSNLSLNSGALNQVDVNGVNSASSSNLYLGFINSSSSSIASSNLSSSSTQSLAVNQNQNTGSQTSATQNTGSQTSESQTNTANNVTQNSGSNHEIQAIKITKIYTTGENDFIELYNPNNFAIDLEKEKYRLEKAKTAIDPGIMMRIGNSADGSYPGGVIIPAKSYYLIVKSTASSFYLNLADAIATRSDFNMASSQQTIYLGTGAISSYDDEDIVDVVGFGENASYYLGSSPAPKIEDYHFLNRIDFKNNNSLDFNLLLSAEPEAITAWQALNNFSEESNDEEDQNNQEENNNENNQEESSLENLDDEDPPSGESNIQEGEVQDENPVENNPELPIEEEPEEPIEPEPEDPIEDEIEPELEEPIEPEDPVEPEPEEPIEPEEPVEPEPEPEIPIEPVPAPDLNLVMINKIGVFGGDDYIELINFSDMAIDLAENNFRLEKAVTALDPAIMIRIGDPGDGHYPGGTIIEAGSTYLIVREGADQRLLDMADAIASRVEFNLGSSGYSVYLGAAPISSPDDEDIIDLVGYGENALYYSGVQPAPTISDYYFLQRTDRFKDNHLDFSLVYDDFYFEEDQGNGGENNSGDGEGGDEENPNQNLGTSQFVPGLKYLWDFDDCYETYAGQVIVGKYFCGRRLGYSAGNFSADLEDGLDMNNFSIGFYHRNDFYWPRIDISLLNDYGNSFSVSADQSSIIVGGLVDGASVSASVNMGNSWSYFTLVVNRSDSYWSIYSNGQEVLRRAFLAELPNMKYFSLSGGNNSMSFDEIAIWDRALSGDEILEMLEVNLPLYPREEREIEESAEFLYNWNFQEYGGNFALDSVSATTMFISDNFWTSRGINNHSLVINNDSPIEVNFSDDILNRSLSLAFWWRNYSHPNNGNIRIELKNNDFYGGIIKKFGLSISPYNQKYIFNRVEGCIAESFSSLIPGDGAWHHIALVYDSYNYRLRFFVDGLIRMSMDVLPYKNGEEKINTLIISSDANPSSIDDLMIFKGALTQVELREIYDNSKISGAFY